MFRILSPPWTQTSLIRLLGILLIACTGKQTNEIPSLLFSSINEASKAETDLLC